MIEPNPYPLDFSFHPFSLTYFIGALGDYLRYVQIRENLSVIEQEGRRNLRALGGKPVIAEKAIKQVDILLQFYYTVNHCKVTYNHTRRDAGECAYRPVRTSFPKKKSKVTNPTTINLYLLSEINANLVVGAQEALAFTPERFTRLKATTAKTQDGAIWQRGGSFRFWPMEDAYYVFKKSYHIWW